LISGWNNGKCEGELSSRRVNVVSNGDRLVKRGVGKFKSPSVGVILSRTPFNGDRSSASRILRNLESEGGNERRDEGEEAKLAEHFEIVKSEDC